MPEIVKSMLPLFIDLVGTISDKVINGEDFGDHDKRILLTAHHILSVWGRHFAEDTETTLDDKAVQEALEFCVDTAEEAGVTLPNYVI